MDRMMKQGKVDTHPSPHLANLVNRILFSVLYWIIRRRARLRRAPKKFLVVKIDGIGDLVLFGACLKQLRDLYKRDTLYLVVSKEVASLAPLLASVAVGSLLYVALSFALGSVGESDRNSIRRYLETSPLRVLARAL